MISKSGFERWITANPGDIFSDDVVCGHCGGRDLQRETNILGEEFVSAMSYKAISPNRRVRQQLVDICLGSDAQNEKWFQLSLLLSMATEDSPP